MATNVCGQSQRSNVLFSKGIAAYEKHKYADAIKFFLVMDSIDEIEMAQDDGHKGYGHHWAAYCHYLNGDTIAAQQLYPYQYKLKPVNRNLTIVSDSLSTLGMKAFNGRRFSEAIRLLTACSEEEARILDRNHYFRANTLQTLGYASAELMRKDDVIRYLEESNQIYRKNGLWSGIIFNASPLAESYWTMGDSAKYSSVMLEAMNYGKNIDTTFCNMANASLAFTVSDLCCNYGLWSDGWYMASVSLRMLNKMGMADTEDYYRTLQNATLAAYMYDFDDVHEYSHKLCEMEKNYPGTETSINNIMAHAHLLKCTKVSIPEAQRMAKADELIRQIAQQVGENHELYVEGLLLKADLCETNVGMIKEMACVFDNILKQNNYVGLYNKIRMKAYIAISISLQGDNTEALTILRECADTLSCYFTQDTKSLFLNAQILNLIVNYIPTASETAIEYLLKEKSQIEKTPYYGQNTLYSSVLRCLMICYSNTGDIEKCHKYSQEIISIYNKSHCNKEDYIMAVSFTKMDEMITGITSPEFDDAEGLNSLEVSLEFKAPDLSISDDDDHINSTDDFPKLMYFWLKYYRLGNKEKCHQLAKRVKKIAERFEIGTFPYLQFSMYYIMMEQNVPLGKTEHMEIFEQLKSFNEYITKKEAYGSALYSQYILQLMKCYLFLDMQEELENLALEYTDMATDYIKEHFKTMSYDERSQFWFSNNGWFMRDLPILLKLFSSEKLADCTYNGQLLSKGLLLNSERTLADALAKIGNDNISRDYYEVQKMRGELNAMYKRLDANADTLEYLRNTIRLKERTLMAQVSKYGDYTDNLVVSWEDVAKNLKDDECALEYVTVPQDSDFVYGVLIVFSGSQNPLWIELCKQSDINNVESKDYYTTDKLSQLLWNKLEGVVSSISTVYFSASGSLHSIALEYLPLPNGQRIREKYAMRRLSSTREILQRGNQNASWKSIALYGGLDYWADGTDHKDIVAKKRAVAGADGRLSPVEDLEYTKVEVNSINKLMRSKGLRPHVFSRGKGTEGSFKPLSNKGVDLIHIATHGYFAPFDPYLQINEMEKIGLDLQRNASVQEDVQLASAQLMMAGANNAIVGDIEPNQENDGILTALELSRMDFHSVDLVVLSACQTALGMVNGEGVFGLQRGFKKAGVKTIMMSLWEVDDKATQILMTHFYENVLNGLSKQEALNNAQHYLRTMDNGKYENPEYWAAFILLDALN